VGCAICYDIRFPELFRALRDKGADVIVLPAAFTLMTGKDHWEVLSRARAIETQTYFVAVGQTGAHAKGQKWCWGHSMVIDPWGHMVAQCSDGVGTTTTSLDMARIGKVRADVPVAQHHVI
jgi:nitrilase